MFSSRHSAAVFACCTLVLLLLHAKLLTLPYFWDEEGQFIPTALDLLRDGAWVAHSTLPNVHPPGVEAYLVLWYKLFGYSIPITRVAMILLACAGLWLTFQLGHALLPASYKPACIAALLLLCSPLFFMQSFLAQLDMPAMVFTLAALLLFLNRRFAASVLACTALVLMKETGIVTPFVLFCVLNWRREWKRAAYFVAPALALGFWLFVLHRHTGFWLGNPDFAHYNVGYSLQPVRLFMTVARRFYYLFIAEFRWVGTLILIYACRSAPLSRSSAWRITVAVATANIGIVSVFGGAELERYLLPVLPLYCIAVAIAVSMLRTPAAALASICLVVGLVVNLFWNPPYPFPYENNWAMVDFIRLQQQAGAYASQNLQRSSIATAWPYTTALRNPEFGYVDHPLPAIETNDFNYDSIARIPPNKFDALITYTRTWTPENGVIGIPAVRTFLERFYDWHPQITDSECARLGLFPKQRWTRRGQTLTIYTR